MAVRFRIRTQGGQELSFGSLEMFSEFVRSGELAPDDMVYDGDSGEWAPARTHPLVLEAGGEGDASEQDEPTPAAPKSDIGLELAPAPEVPTHEEAVAAFKAKMDAEREIDFDDMRSMGGLRMGTGASGLLEGLEEQQAAPARPPTKRAEPARPGQGDAPDSGRSEPEAPRRRRTPHRGHGRLIALSVGVAATAGVVYAAPTLGPRIAEWMSEEDAGAETARPIPDTEEALRARAEERFLISTRGMLRGLPPIPPDWLDGAYLAEPSVYPGIRAVWSRYLTTIQEVRSTEVERYRAAYLRALDDADVQGSTRTLRLASASAAFLAEAARREGHYTRVERLAAAAIELHDDLAAIEGSISHEPALGPTVSADPVLEAAGTDTESQALLESLLDEVVDALYADGLGPDESVDVQAWAWEGFRSTVGSH